MSGPRSIALRTMRGYTRSPSESRHSADSPLLGEEVFDDDPLNDEAEPLSTGSITIRVGQSQGQRFPPNVISNAKYTPWSFLPVTLFNEFRFFFNLYFLFVALSQIIPALRIGYISTYIVPLAFVLMITLGKEAYDDVTRRRRDAEANAEPFTVLGFYDEPTQKKKARAGSVPQDSDTYDAVRRARDIKVGDILKLTKGDRVPADIVILQSIEPAKDEVDPQLDELIDASDDDAAGVAEVKDNTAETFIRTDQLDGETDWKLRFASPVSQSIDSADLRRLTITAGPPEKSIHDFVGRIEIPSDSETISAPLTVDNTAWSGTVIASSAITLGVVIYTGAHTRQALSTAPTRSKVGLLEYEINSLTKILCALTFALSIILVGLEGFKDTKEGKWYVNIMRFLILFSTIIPISLRVNVDMAKSVYSFFIERDKDIPGTIVRTSTIPEELGRVEYLLSDKTGTLTQNEMELKKVHVGTVSFSQEALTEVAAYVNQSIGNTSELVTPTSINAVTAAGNATRTRREIGSRLRDLVLALALCHNVTPIIEEEHGHTITNYQASSPDEIAIVKWTESVGLRLIKRDRKSIALQAVSSGKTVVAAQILDMFPFTSESKRMGIVVRFNNEEDVYFYQKGADTVMASIVVANDWLDEETANMAREGLRTLVVGKRKLSAQQYREFSAAYHEASISLNDRDTMMSRVVKRFLEHDVELLGVTGVEDKLQKDVKPSLELLRNAGVKVWVLTGDKVETARCVAISAKVVARGQYIHQVTKLRRRDAAQDALDLLQNKTDACLLIDGESLQLYLSQMQDEFIKIAVQLPAVVACRCSPTQKADVAKLIRAYTKKRVCCIGDGGNDVSMIQAADVGIGIVGKEGKQASLAADFSITHFHHLTKLLVWHGRNSYKRSAKLAQFIIHRGLIVSVAQTMFSIASQFEPIALYRDWLLVGYATVYTMMPVFSLVLDTDVDESLVNLYPELYKELTEGRSLSYRTFFVWVFISIYQGCVIQGLSQILCGVEGPHMLSVSYTAIILNELFMVAIEITTFHMIMTFALLGTFVAYFGSIPFLGGYFDLSYLITVAFIWRVLVICSISLIPPYVVKLVRRTLKPTSTMKLRPV
jgi:phospholipid-translocating ATPase